MPAFALPAAKTHVTHRIRTTDLRQAKQRARVVLAQLEVKPGFLASAGASRRTGRGDFNGAFSVCFAGRSRACGSTGGTRRVRLFRGHAELHGWGHALLYGLWVRVAVQAAEYGRRRYNREVSDELDAMRAEKGPSPWQMHLDREARRLTNRSERGECACPGRSGGLENALAGSVQLLVQRKRWARWAADLNRHCGRCPLRSSRGQSLSCATYAPIVCQKHPVAGPRMLCLTASRLVHWWHRTQKREGRLSHCLHRQIRPAPASTPARRLRRGWKR